MIVFIPIFPLSHIQWSLKNHPHFAISLIGYPEQVNKHYPNENWEIGFCPFSVAMAIPMSFQKGLSQASLNIY